MARTHRPPRLSALMLLCTLVLPGLWRGCVASPAVAGQRLPVLEAVRLNWLEEVRQKQHQRQQHNDQRVQPSHDQKEETEQGKEKEDQQTEEEEEAAERHLDVDVGDVKSVVILASLPYSGSHLLRRLIEAATGRPTFSIYQEV